MTIQHDRAAILELYAEACDQLGPCDPDWQALAHELAALLPRPKVSAKPDALEWCEYTAAQHRGKGNMFRPMQVADFVFADLTWIRAPMIWRKSKDLPDWRRAARMAVHFYRARMCRGERCAVPAIVLARDPGRGVCADPVKASEATAELREGLAMPADSHLPWCAIERRRMVEGMKIRLPMAA